MAGASVDELVRATRHADWTKRWEAVNELGKRKESGGIPALLERALSDTNPHPRWRSLWALRAIDRNGTSVIPRLLKALEDANPETVRNSAVALAFYGREEARPYLIQALASPTEFRRWEAVYSFRRLAGTVALDVLLPHIDAANEPSERVRGEMVLFLGRLGGEQVAPALLETLHKDASAAVRYRAALALAGVRDACLTAKLRKAMSTETETMVREQIARAIAAIDRMSEPRYCPGDKPAVSR